MAQRFAWSAQGQVGEPQGRAMATGQQRLIGPHQGQAAGPAGITGLQHLGRQGDPAAMALEGLPQGGVIGGPPATRPFKHHIDRHRRGPGLEQSLG